MVRFGRVRENAGNIRGRQNELRVCRILQERVRTVPWLRDVRLATPEEDRYGVDIVCELDNGFFAFVQVKSSLTGKCGFRRRFWLTDLAVLPVVVQVADRRSDEVLGDECMAAIAHARATALKMDPVQWICWAQDIDKINRSVMHSRLARFMAMDWADAIERRRRSSGDPGAFWIRFAEVRGSNVLLATRGGPPLLLRCVFTEEEATQLRRELQTTFFRAAILVTLPFRELSTDQCERLLLEWWDQHQLWMQKIKLNRGNT